MLWHKLRQTPQPGPCSNFPTEFNIYHLFPLANRVGGTAWNRGQCFTFKQCRAESGLEAASFQNQKLWGGSFPFLSVFWRLVGLRRVLGSPFMAVRAKPGHPDSSGSFLSLHWEHAKDDSGQDAADAGVALKVVHRKRMHMAFQGSCCSHTLQN